MIDQLKPGQDIRCTITKTPRAEDKTQTIARLMRQDPAISKGLRKSQESRRKNMYTYIRGGKAWHQREKCGKIAKVADGQSWTMTYVPQLAGDLKAVESFLSVEKA